MDDAWPGCHGVRLGPPELASGYGASRGRPLAEAELVRGSADPPGDHELWHIRETVVVDGREVAVDQRLQRRGDGSRVLVDSGRAVLAVDPTSSRITLAVEDQPMAQQLVTTVALPLVLHERHVLVLHASACAVGAEAVVVCASSGTGKSSLLVGLVDAGWQPVSEDMCAIDVDADPPLVWPGPPWVRRAHSEPGPAGAAVRFRTEDKVAWDIDPVQVRTPIAVTRLVFLEPAGGDEIVWHPLTKSEALMRLARDAVWLGDPDDRAEALFGPCARLVGRVAAARLRMPVSASWLERVAAVLAGG